MPSLPSVSDVKVYLGITTSGDDALIASLLPAGIADAERDTGRTFSSASNTTRTYSSNGDALIAIHDRPVTDPSRVVTWNGATMVENVNYWMLPDRRDPNISTQLQIRQFDTSRTDWYKADPQWWDKNLDNRRWPIGTPQDISVSGIIGHPFPQADVAWAATYATAVLYFGAKSGASGVVYTPSGEPISIDGESLRYRKFIANWRITKAVDHVG